MKTRALLTVIVALFVLLLLNMTQGIAQRSFPLRINRWLLVQQIAGNVTYEQGTASRPAHVGDRLEAVGDGITTGKSASTTLAADIGIGFITMSENTSLRIQGLEIAPDNGRITRLQISGGQAHFKIRPFTHRGSRLEIQTPAGLSGVRGTEFGLNVQPSGKTGLATLAGRVVSAAQGREVTVARGFQNFTIPGEPPSAPVSLRNDTRLKYEFQKVIQGGVRQIRLLGQVDPVNNVIVNAIPRTTDRNGRFSVSLFVPSLLKIQVIVITPLGKKGVYELVFR